LPQRSSSKSAALFQSPQVPGMGFSFTSA